MVPAVLVPVRWASSTAAGAISVENAERVGRNDVLIAAAAATAAADAATLTTARRRHTMTYDVRHDHVPL